MGTRSGFMGKSVMAFAIMASVLRKVSPQLFVHECTQTFDASIFASLFPNYAVESVLTHPTDFGFPVRRTRLYTLLVRDDFKLLRGMDDLHRLYISPGMDCSAFRAAEEQEAGLEVGLDLT